MIITAGKWAESGYEVLAGSIGAKSAGWQACVDCDGGQMRCCFSGDHCVEA